MRSRIIVSANRFTKITVIRSVMITIRTTAIIKTNRVITTTVKMVMATTGVLMKGMMIAGFATTNISTSAHMVMKEEKNLKDITVAGSLVDFPFGTGNRLATN